MGEYILIGGVLLVAVAFVAMIAILAMRKGRGQPVSETMMVPSDSWKHHEHLLIEQTKLGGMIFERLKSACSQNFNGRLLAMLRESGQANSYDIVVSWLGPNNPSRCPLKEPLVILEVKINLMTVAKPIIVTHPIEKREFEYKNEKSQISTFLRKTGLYIVNYPVIYPH